MNLSIKRLKYWTIAVYVVAALVFSATVTNTEDDPILKHYTTRAASVYAGHNPFETGLSFSFTMKTYYKELNKQSVFALRDSSVVTYYFSFSEIDSTAVIVEPQREFEEIPIKYPNIFEEDYIFNFFPNDSGSSLMSIGFDSRTYNIELPVGLAIIDRDKYRLRSLYLYYINPQKYKRHSTGYRFTEFSGFVVPDSIWSVKSRRKFFSSEDYRYESGLYDYKITKTGN